jgi:glycosyltransferase involved in cell wall biosynthesis
MPATEAMACAVPVVCTDGGALPEVVGDAGVTVPAADDRALERAIAGLLEDPAQRERLARAGRERMEQQFCWQLAAGEMTRYYREVITRANR